jgi:predicted MFS family arabinose efflux permease
MAEAITHVRPILAAVLFLLSFSLTATALGVIFPLITHVSIDPSEQVGSRVSYIYLANIIGSTLGSLLTGFVLMQFIGVANISAVPGVLGMLAGVLKLVVVRRAARVCWSQSPAPGSEISLR